MRYNLSRDFWQNEPKLGHRGADQAFSIFVDLQNKYDWVIMSCSLGWNGYPLIWGSSW
jgi:hypothetical protein